MRRFVGSVLIVCGLGSMACSDDDSRQVSASDAGALDATIEPRDAQLRDAELDAAVCSLASGGVRYYLSGGLGGDGEYYSIIAPGYFGLEGVNAYDGGPASCRTTLASCGASEVDPGDINAALSMPDVISAFAGDQTRVLGRDNRVVDGQVLIVERDDQRRITVGEPCGESTACVPIPPGVLELRALLFRLIREQDAAGLCASNLF